MRAILKLNGNIDGETRNELWEFINDHYPFVMIFDSDYNQDEWELVPGISTSSFKDEVATIVELLEDDDRKDVASIAIHRGVSSR